MVRLGFIPKGSDMKMQLYNYLILIFFFSLTAVSPGFSQSLEESHQKTAKVTGLVYDAESLEPLDETNIYFDNTLIGDASKRNGRFNINNLNAGTYKLVVDRIGYRKYYENITINPGDSLFKSIGLEPALLQTDAVTVTATIREQTAQMAPADVDVISTKDLARRSITTFDQALETVPGISVFRSAGTSVQSMSIRGSSDVAGGGVGNRVLLLVDGRPSLSSDTGGALWSLVPLNIIDHIEILKGAFSSLYGSTAMGGVVNVITRRPAYKRLTNINLGYGIYEKADPAIRYTDKLLIFRQMQLSYSGVANKWSYLFNISHKYSDGYSQNTQYSFYNIFTKLIYDLNANRYLELTLNNSTGNNKYPHTWEGNLHPLEVSPEFRDDRQEKKNLSADLKYWAVPSDRLKYSSRFYVYRNTSNSTFNTDDPDLKIPKNQPYGFETRVNADKYGHITQVDYYVSNTNNVIAGLDVQIDKVVSSPDSILYGNQQVNNIAGYLQDEWQLSPQFTTTMGLRYDYNHLVGGITQTQLSSNFAAIYKLHPNLSCRFLVGQAFRAPSIAERFLKVEPNGGTLFKPNPKLKAERMDLSLESGLNWNPVNSLNIGASYFRYHYKDMIYWEEISAEEKVVYTLYQVRNLNRALIQGLEFSLNYNPFENLRTNLSYTYLDARDQSPGRINDYLPYRVKHSLNASADWMFGDFILHIDSRYKSKVNEVPFYHLEAPDAFTVANGKLSWQFNKHFNFSVAGNNLLNTKYEELARYRMPGRNWFLETNIQF